MKGESRPNSGILLAEFPLRFPSRVNLVQENPEKIVSDYQRTRTVETIRRRAALPKYLVHGFRRGSHRRDWAEWIGQVYLVGDADWHRETGQRRCGDPQRNATQLRGADFGIRFRRDDSFGHGERVRTRGGARRRTRSAFR